MVAKKVPFMVDTQSQNEKTPARQAFLPTGVLRRRAEYLLSYP